MIMEALRRAPLFLSLFSPLLLWCTAPPSLPMEILPDQLRSCAPMENVCSLTAFGTIRFSLRGEQHSAKIDVVWHGDSNFTIALYSPLGGTLASAASDSLGVWKIIAADSVFIKSPQDRVSMGEYFDYSLTFREFIRIATGRLLDTAILGKPSDSLSLKGKKAFLYWHEDSTGVHPFDITAIVDRKHFSITNVIYTMKASSRWEASVASDRKGAPEEIRFRDGNNNYFYVSYKTVIVKRGGRCRGEKL